ncbi:MAG: sugar ABC transporter permease [Novibacillus thermophilus]
MKAETQDVSAKTHKLSFVKWDVRAYALIIALAAIWAIFTILTDGAFLSDRNLSNLFRQMSVISVLAIGMVLVIVAAHIDLSVGSVAGLTGGVAAALHVWLGFNTAISIGAALLLGILIGLWQGWWVAYRMVPAFIVTLDGMLAFRGMLLAISQGQTIAPLSDSFKSIAQSYIPVSVGWGLGGLVVVCTAYVFFRRRKSRMSYGFDTPPVAADLVKVAVISLLTLFFVFLMNAYKGIPTPIILVLLLGIVFTFIAQNTSFGRQIYAIGGNMDAARLSGINIKRKVLMVFVLNGFMAAVAGVLLTARVNAASPAAGEMYELDAIAAAVIGGTSLMGGTGTIVGAVIGALVMASIDNGMSMLNADVYWQYIVKGLILIVAVWIDVVSKRKKA